MIIYSTSNAYIWRTEEPYGPDFYVYVNNALVRVCPSIGMAHEVMASAII